MTATTADQLHQLIAKWRIYGGAIDAAPVWEVRAAFLWCATDLEAAILAAPLPQPEGWQPIATAPKDGLSVLVWDGFDVMTARHVLVGHSEDTKEPFYQWVTDAICAEEPTHWMPLPPAPLVTEGNR